MDGWMDEMFKEEILTRCRLNHICRALLSQPGCRASCFVRMHLTVVAFCCRMYDRCMVTRMDGCMKNGYMDGWMHGYTDGGCMNDGCMKNGYIKNGYMDGGYIQGKYTWMVATWMMDT